jgi:hypothetical protein
MNPADLACAMAEARKWSRRLALFSIAVLVALVAGILTCAANGGGM